MALHQYGEKEQKLSKLFSLFLTHSHRILPRPVLALALARAARSLSVWLDFMHRTPDGQARDAMRAPKISNATLEPIGAKYGVAREASAKSLGLSPAPACTPQSVP